MFGEVGLDQFHEVLLEGDPTARGILPGALEDEGRLGEDVGQPDGRLATQGAGFGHWGSFTPLAPCDGRTAASR